MKAQHGHYRDQRQPTGACFYCPKMDWRYPSAAIVGEDMTVFCPGCGEPQAAGNRDGRTVILEGYPSRTRMSGPYGFECEECMTPVRFQVRQRTKHTVRIDTKCLCGDDDGKRWWVQRLLPAKQEERGP